MNIFDEGDDGFDSTEENGPDGLGCQKRGRPASLVKFNRFTEASAGYVLALPLPPTGNHALMPVRMGRTMRLILAPEMRAYKEEVRALMEEQRLTGMRPFLGNVFLTFRVYRARRSGDADKAIKAMIDGLTGYAFLDDRQVEGYVVWRDLDPDNPRVEVEVVPYQKKEEV